ncbi:MAG: Hsp20/alpha crystallin family protein [Methanobacterium sp.]|nr:Hsp20/alpha crystallin family protein [Methanobacterium sp.]
MKNHNDIMDMRDFVKQMLEDTAKTVDMVRQDIEKSIVDYNFLPGKYLFETDENIIVNVALPGIKKENLKLKVTESKVMVEAKFDVEHAITGAYVTLSDKKSGTIHRTVELPKNVIAEEAKASYKNGILKVEIPKVEKEPSVEVKID